MPEFESATEKNNNEELYKLVIETKGVSHQIDKAIEEMSELIKELIKWKHGNDNIVSLSLEQADTKIMLEQLEIMLDNRMLVKEGNEHKLKRLNNKLVNGEL